jgi:beta-lactamase superfamily II metal-dependent hydrolase
MIKNIGDNYRIYGLIIIKITKKLLVLDYGLSNATFETPNHVFAPLLTTRGVFEEAKLGFLVISHTHEDIDGCFGYLSKTLKEENNYISTNLMRVFMNS